MVTAQDVKSGYGQKRYKPSTSVLPYLRAQQAEKEAVGKIAVDKLTTPSMNRKSEPEKATDKKDEARLEQYSRARLEILRG